MGEKLNPNEVKALQHWALFGRPGRPSSQRVIASAWKTKPFKRPERVSWNVTIPAEKLEPLLNGIRPEEMEDKWFVYADGPDADGYAKLHMYHSWTGFKMIELDIQMSSNGNDAKMDWKAEIIAIKFETDGERIRDQSEESAKFQALQVCEWVLGVTLKEMQSK